MTTGLFNVVCTYTETVVPPPTFTLQVTWPTTANAGDTASITTAGTAPAVSLNTVAQSGGNTSTAPAVTVGFGDTVTLPAPSYGAGNTGAYTLAPACTYTDSSNASHSITLDVSGSFTVTTDMVNLTCIYSGAGGTGSSTAAPVPAPAPMLQERLLALLAVTLLAAGGLARKRQR